MNAKRISARLIVATMTVGTAMSVAAPAWADLENEQSELLDANSGVEGAQDDSACLLQASPISNDCSAPLDLGELPLPLG
jgi:hypothetical protein